MVVIEQAAGATARMATAITAAAAAAGRAAGPQRRQSRQRRLRVVAEAATKQRSYSVLLLPGDGIGPEIMAASKDVLVAACALEGVELAFSEGLIGGAALDATGVPLPQETTDMAKGAEAVLLAAIGGYKWDSNPPTLRPERGLLSLRSELACFANLRPATVFPALAGASSLRADVVAGVDLMVVRELTGGIYFGEPRGVVEEGEAGERKGFNTMVYSESEIERITRVAISVARARGKRIVSVDKSNVLEVSQLWKEVVTRIVEQEAPEVELAHMYVDNAAMQLVRNPSQFDVLLTSNLFGDILSDIAAMLTGSIGMLPSASIGESGKPGIFEPVHGSAPDIAGEDKANPLAQILSAAMMLRYGLGEPAAADRIEAAVARAIESGARTGDIAGDSSGTTPLGCRAMGELVAKFVQDAPLKV